MQAEGPSIYEAVTIPTMRDLAQAVEIGPQTETMSKFHPLSERFAAAWLEREMQRDIERQPISDSERAEGFAAGVRATARKALSIIEAGRSEWSGLDAAMPYNAAEPEQ